MQGSCQLINSVSPVPTIRSEVMHGTQKAAYDRYPEAHTIWNCKMWKKKIVNEERTSHCRRLVKNIGWANPNNGGQKVVKCDKCMGVFQLLGDTCPGCPHSLLLWDFLPM